jgi:hypothetical protein
MIRWRYLMPNQRSRRTFARRALALALARARSPRERADEHRCVRSRATRAWRRASRWYVTRECE